MANGDPNYYSSLVADCGSITNTTAGDYTYYCEPLRCQEPIVSIPYDMLHQSVWCAPINNKKKGGENMRYLYEVILVNPKDDTFWTYEVVAKSETSALMKTYKTSTFYDKVEFDDLKTSCHILMEWKKEQRTTAVE